MPSAGGSASAAEASESASRISSLVALGVPERLANSLGASAKTYNALHSGLSAAGLSSETGRSDTVVASLVCSAVTKLAGTTVGPRGRALLFKAIGDGRIETTPKVEAAAAWLGKLYRGANQVPNASVKIDEDNIALDEEAFCVAAGVGVNVGEDDIARAVKEVLKDNEKEIKEKRYRFSLGILQRDVMRELKFADGKVVSEAIRKAVEEMLGPKTEVDMAKPPKVKKTKPAKPAAPTGAAASEKAVGMEENENPFEGIPSRFDARGLASMENSPELIEAHKKATGGKVVCRFPPEPNGYLHVGHAKAMFIDFGYAKKMNGECILRYDDTNPVGEETEYIKSIEEMARWMGHVPTRVTYSSEYFPRLYELAVELIKRGKAYVCFQTSEEMRRDREAKVESPYRNRSIEENLRLFEDMRKGKFDEGEATLRMKIDMQNANPCMRDPVAYRVIFAPHPHVGDKWVIYPSYDYTHCLVDSLEWITHSLCTLEFEIRRDSYYWLLEALDLYRPFVWEFARLNLAYTMMSKRKLKQLVDQNYVRGWDDPRMPTLSGMRRRGYPATALNRFCSAIGASRGTNVIGMHVLEYWIRSDLDPRVPRVLAVLRPLKLTITNFRGEETLTIANHPKDETMGKRDVTLTKTVYIERTDFRMVDEKSYYGLAPGKTAMLRYAYPVTITDVKQDPEGTVTELFGTFDYEKSVKPKGVLHWVNERAPNVEVRLYDRLFKSENPAALRDAWLDDLNPDSEIILNDARIEEARGSVKVGSEFQFERNGYFVTDTEHTLEKPIFNMVVSLRDSR